jgi:hypothetical protein
VKPVSRLVKGLIPFIKLLLIPTQLCHHHPTSSLSSSSVTQAIESYDIFDPRHSILAQESTVVTRI